MVFRIFKSIFTLLLVGSALSAPFTNNLIDFFKLLAFSIIIQIICFDIYQRIVSTKNKRIELEKIKEFTKQGCELRCPCHLNKKMFIPIRLNEDNSFKCLDCSKNVSVKVDVKSFLETETIDLEKADRDFIAAIKKIKGDEHE